jgi:hypothetical protein
MKITVRRPITRVYIIRGTGPARRGRTDYGKRPVESDSYPARRPLKGSVCLLALRPVPGLPVAAGAAGPISSWRLKRKSLLFLLTAKNHLIILPIDAKKKVSADTEPHARLYGYAFSIFCRNYAKL